MNESNVLITGGSGFLAKRLAESLKADNRSVCFLSRRAGTNADTYTWDVKNKTIDFAAIKNTETIVHLAGSGIADKKWTKNYKKEILESRVESLNLLFQILKNTPNNVKTVVSASATGGYGNTGDQWVDENNELTTGFLGKTCSEWEKSARQFEALGIRVVIFRIGIVMDAIHGALPSLVLPVKLFVGSVLGSGKQYISWIHVDDLCRLFVFALDNEKIKGVYNAVSPDPVTHERFIRHCGELLNRRIWPLKISPFFLRLILGEKAELVLDGQRVSSAKIVNEGFRFQHSETKNALAAILLKKH
jgi:uncharacterized protein (TIGR01777 family)